MEQALGLVDAVFGWPAAAAAVVAFCLVAAGRPLERTWPAIDLLPWGLAGGFVAGAIATERAVLPLNPDQPWHWLPFLAFPLAALGSALGVVCRTHWWGGLCNALAIAAICGAILTPAWPLWGWQQPYSLVFGGTYLSVLMACLLGIERRAGLGRWLVGGMAAAAIVTAVAIAALVSFRLAQPAGLAGAAFAASFTVIAWARRGELERRASVIPLYAVLVGGTAFTACVEPDPPQVWLLLGPLAAAAIWPVKALAERAFARPSASSRIS